MANNDYKAKASVLRAMMNNPSLQRTMLDALNAPLGSTQRTKAKDVFSAFHKVISNKMDGQGGPATTSNIPSFSYTAPTTSFNPNSYSNIRIMPSIPDPKTSSSLGDFSNLSNSLNPSINSNASLNGGNTFNATPSIPSVPTLNSGSQLPKSTATSLQDLLKSIQQPSPTLNTGSTLSPALSQAYKQTQQESALSNLRKETGVNQVGGANPATFATTYGKDNLQNLMNTLNSMKKTTAPSTTPNVPGAPTNNPASSSPPTASTTNEATTTPGTTGTTTNPNGTYAGDPAIQAQWDALSPEDQQKYKPVFDAAYSKLGAGTFFYGAMSDTETLKKMFPGLSDADLPHGASLSGQMDDLQKTLKSQYGLDQLLAQKTQLANDSDNFTQDMTDYISGRDQFLGGVNKMIQDAENKSVNITTPYAASTMKNYLNYLYVLKGRQNKNYVDYLNTAINAQNNKVKNVDTEYNNMLTAYNEEFKNQSAIKTDDYNRWYTILTDMYNKLDTSLSTQLDLQKKQADIDQVYAGMSIDAIKAQATAGKTESWLKEMPQYESFILDQNTKTKNQLLPGVNLASVVARATDNDLNPQGVFDTFQIGARNSIAASAGDPASLNTTMNNITDVLRSYNATTKGQNAPAINDMIQGLGAQTSDQISGYIGSNGKSLIQAIQDLGNNKNKTSAEFIRNHPDLDSTIAKNLFDYYKMNPEYASSPQKLFSNTGKLSETDLPQIKDIIAKAISRAWNQNLTTSVNQY